MYCHRSFGLGNNLQEIFHNILRRTSSVGKEQIHMPNASVGKSI